MHDELAAEQVGAHGEERSLELLHVGVAEDPLEHGRRAARPDQRDARDRVVAERRASDELRLADTDHPIGVPAEGRHAADERADAAAADSIGFEARGPERLKRADVREPSCAATREHEPERATGQSAGDPRDCLGVPMRNDVVRRRFERLEPRADHVGRRGPEEDGIRSAQSRVFGDRLRSVRDDELAVGLPQREVLPRRCGREIREQEDVLVPRLGLGDGRGDVARHVGRSQRDGRPDRGELGRELPAKRLGNGGRSGGDDREDGGARGRWQQAAAPLELGRERANERIREADVAGDELVEGVGGEGDHLGVADRLGRRRPRRPRQHAELAEERSGPDDAQRRLLLAHDAQPTRGDDVQPIRRVAATEEPLARGDDLQARGCLECVERGLRGRREDRDPTERRLGQRRLSYAATPANLGMISSP